MQQDVDKMGFPQFKSGLKNFEENEKARIDYHSEEDNVIKTSFKQKSDSYSEKKIW